MISLFIQNCFAKPAAWTAYLDILASIPENY